MLKVVGLSGAVSGSQTLTTLREVEKEVGRSYGTEVEFTLLDLRTLTVAFSDGRDYHEYEGDTAKVATTLAEADALIIGAPVFQGGMPGALKNVLDLLPEDGLKGKVVSLVINAGSPRYFLASEYQFKPILAAMKAKVITEVAFIEAREIYRTEIIEDETKQRIDRVARQAIDYALSTNQ